MSNPFLITDLAALEALYDAPVAEGSRLKETDRIVPVYRAIIAAAPFAVLATLGADGLDCSPRAWFRPGSRRKNTPAARSAGQQPHRFAP